MATNSDNSAAATTAGSGGTPQPQINSATNTQNQSITAQDQANSAALMQAYSNAATKSIVDVNNNMGAAAPPTNPPAPPVNAVSTSTATGYTTNPSGVIISAPPSTYSLGPTYAQQTQQAAQNNAALLSNYNNQMNAAAAAANNSNLIANLNAANFANYLAAVSNASSNVPNGVSAAYATAPNFLNGLMGAGAAQAQSAYNTQPPVTMATQSSPAAANVLLNGLGSSLANLNGHHHHLQSSQSGNHFSSHHLTNGNGGAALAGHHHLAGSQASQQGHHQDDNHNLYDYMHQLLEEKERLKELFNEPFNILLPISARLLDEGKSTHFHYHFQTNLILPP